MSFAMTVPQILAQTKTVTRRFGWDGLAIGTLLQPVRKAMGLRKGEKAERIGCPIIVEHVREMLLADISPEDCAREGFPELTPHQFVMMLSHHYKNPTLSYSRCNRIEFRYVNYPGQWVKRDGQLHEVAHV